MNNIIKGKLKGFDFIIKSLGAIQERNRPELIIAGNTSNKSYVSYIKSLANKLNVSLTIKENINDVELSKLYYISTVFAYAPLLEPLGLTPLEAMSSGLPVVSVKEGGPRETITDGFDGILSERDIFEFGKNIYFILQSDTLWGKLSKNAKDSISSY